MSGLPASQGIHLAPPSLRKRFEPVGGVSISAVTGQWIAVFHNGITEPIVAFDNAGNALIMHEPWGTLIRANAHNDFLRVGFVDSSAADDVTEEAA